MEFLINNLLTFILFTPVLAAFIVFLIPRDQETLIRWGAFLLSFLPLVFTLVLWFNFQPDTTGLPIPAAGGLVCADQLILSCGRGWDFADPWSYSPPC